MSAQPPQPGPTPVSPDGPQSRTVPPPPPQRPDPQADPQWQPPSGGESATHTLSIATVCQVAALVLTIVALALSTDGQDSWYSDTTAWAVFATLAAIMQLAPTVGPKAGWCAEKAWTIGAVGAAGLFAWWVLIALPAVSSNPGFTATMAVAAALTGSWLAPGRRL